MKEEIYKKLPEALLPWYQANKRELPWRRDKDPYHVWISEIMLQQTRVEAVRGYYSRFLDVLPTVEILANADDELLHKLWEGLGYYSRVRNLKKAAQMIVLKYGGIFPSKYEDIIKLPGIGEYTAGAICSISFNLPTPAVDGNVLRVITRLINDETPIDRPALKSEIREQLIRIYPKEAGDFTQALMELGATACSPNRTPQCESCPCKSFCLGCAAGEPARLPIKSLKRQRKTEERTVFILSCEGAYALEKRPNEGLLAGLWQFPNLNEKLDTQSALLQVEKMCMHPKEILRQVEKKHIFTHIQWDMRGIYIEVSDMVEDYQWFSMEQLRKNAAIPTAFRQFLDEIK